VLLNVEENEYFAYLSSPTPKHKNLKNTLDLIKMDNDNLGVINFNNMITVTKNNYTEYDLNKKYNDKEEISRINLLSIQLRWLTSNRKEVIIKSKILYTLYKNNKLPKNIKDRCSNFILLEEKCNEYNKILV